MLRLYSCVQLFATPWTVAHQAPLSMEFSRQEYWSGLPFPSPGNLPIPGIEPVSLVSPALQAHPLPKPGPSEWKHQVLTTGQIGDSIFFLSCFLSFLLTWVLPSDQELHIRLHQIYLGSFQTSTDTWATISVSMLCSQVPFKASQVAMFEICCLSHLNILSSLMHKTPSFPSYLLHFTTKYLGTVVHTCCLLYYQVTLNWNLLCASNILNYITSLFIKIKDTSSLVVLDLTRVLDACGCSL